MSAACARGRCREVARGTVPGHGLVANFTCPGGGGGAEANFFCVPKIDLQFWAPLINFIFFPSRNFPMFVGGGARRRSPGCYSAPPPPRPPVTLSHGLHNTLRAAVALPDASGRFHQVP